MPDNKPPSEVTISHELISTMLKEFVPDLAGEPLSLLGAGWDNEIHRLGTTHAVRLPRREAAAILVENEQRWLPELAPNLPLPIPEPTYAGRPAFGFPWHWSVVRWLPGIPLAHAPKPDRSRLMHDLSEFMNALHVPAPEDAPSNPFRGIDLSERDTITRDRIELLDGIDSEPLMALWEELVDTPAWGGDPIWLHGDVHPMNMLVRGGHLSAILDFGDITAGDPATDLAIAWMLFDADERDEFRKKLSIDGRSVDIHTWNRSRAWALSLALAYRTNSADDPTMRRISVTTLAAVME